MMDHLVDFFAFTQGSAAHKRELDKDDIAIMYSLMNNKSKPFADVPTKGEDLEKMFIQECGECPAQVAMIARRLMIITPDIEYIPATILLLSSMVKVPPHAVILAHAIAKATQRDGLVTVKDIGLKYLPDGYPTDEAFTKFWEKQKLPGDLNALDDVRYWSAA